MLFISKNKFLLKEKVAKIIHSRHKRRFSNIREEVIEKAVENAKEAIQIQITFVTTSYLLATIVLAN